MWIYSQGLGTLYRRQSVGSPATVVATGYAGRDVGLNNPTMQCMQDIGPLPRGAYTIGAPVTGPTDYSLPLTPNIGTDMCNPARTRSYIHGDYRNNEIPRLPDAASKGCIILSRAVRTQVWESGDTALTVVEYAPG